MQNNNNVFLPHEPLRVTVDAKLVEHIAASPLPFVNQGQSPAQTSPQDNNPKPQGDVSTVYQKVSVLYGGHQQTLLMPMSMVSPPVVPQDTTMSRTTPFVPTNSPPTSIGTHFEVPQNDFKSQYQTDAGNISPKQPLPLSPKQRPLLPKPGVVTVNKNSCEFPKQPRGRPEKTGADTTNDNDAQLPKLGRPRKTQAFSPAQKYKKIDEKRRISKSLTSVNTLVPLACTTSPILNLNHALISHSVVFNHGGILHGNNASCNSVPLKQTRRRYKKRKPKATKSLDSSDTLSSVNNGNHVTVPENESNGMGVEEPFLKIHSVYSLSDVKNDNGIYDETLTVPFYPSNGGTETPIESATPVQNVENEQNDKDKDSITHQNFDSAEGVLESYKDKKCRSLFSALSDLTALDTHDTSRDADDMGGKDEAAGLNCSAKVTAINQHTVDVNKPNGLITNVTDNMRSEECISPHCEPDNVRIGDKISEGEDIELSKTNQSCEKPFVYGTQSVDAKNDFKQNISEKVTHTDSDIVACTAGLKNIFKGVSMFQKGTNQSNSLPEQTNSETNVVRKDNSSPMKGKKNRGRSLADIVKSLGGGSTIFQKEKAVAMNEQKLDKKKSVVLDHISLVQKCGHPCASSETLVNANDADTSSITTSRDDFLKAIQLTNAVKHVECLRAEVESHTKPSEVELTTVPKIVDNGEQRLNLTSELHVTVDHNFDQVVESVLSADESFEIGEFDSPTKRSAYEALPDPDDCENDKMKSQSALCSNNQLELAGTSGICKDLAPPCLSSVENLHEKDKDIMKKDGVDYSQDMRGRAPSVVKEETYIESEVMSSKEQLSVSGKKPKSVEDAESKLVKQVANNVKCNAIRNAPVISTVMTVEKFTGGSKTEDIVETPRMEMCSGEEKNEQVKHVEDSNPVVPPNNNLGLYDGTTEESVGSRTASDSSGSSIAPEDFEILQHALSSYVALDDISYALRGAYRIDIHDLPLDTNLRIRRPSTLDGLKLSSENPTQNQADDAKRAQDIKEWVESSHVAGPPDEIASSTSLALPPHLEMESALEESNELDVSDSPPDIQFEKYKWYDHSYSKQTARKTFSKGRQNPVKQGRPTLDSDLSDEEFLKQNSRKKAIELTFNERKRLNRIRERSHRKKKLSESSPGNHSSEAVSVTSPKIPTPVNNASNAAIISCLNNKIEKPVVSKGASLLSVAVPLVGKGRSAQKNGKPLQQKMSRDEKRLKQKLNMRRYRERLKLQKAQMKENAVSPATTSPVSDEPLERAPAGKSNAIFPTSNDKSSRDSKQKLTIEESKLRNTVRAREWRRKKKLEARQDEVRRPLKKSKILPETSTSDKDIFEIDKKKFPCLARGLHTNQGTEKEAIAKNSLIKAMSLKKDSKSGLSDANQTLVNLLKKATDSNAESAMDKTGFSSDVFSFKSDSSAEDDSNHAFLKKFVHKVEPRNQGLADPARKENCGEACVSKKKRKKKRACTSSKSQLRKYAKYAKDRKERMKETQVVAEDADDSDDAVQEGEVSETKSVEDDLQTVPFTKQGHSRRGSASNALDANANKNKALGTGEPLASSAMSTPIPTASRKLISDNSDTQGPLAPFSLSPIPVSRNGHDEHSEVKLQNGPSPFDMNSNVVDNTCSLKRDGVEADGEHSSLQPKRGRGRPKKHATGRPRGRPRKHSLDSTCTSSFSVHDAVNEDADNTDDVVSNKSKSSVKADKYELIAKKRKEKVQRKKARGVKFMKSRWGKTVKSAASGSVSNGHSEDVSTTDLDSSVYLKNSRNLGQKSTDSSSDALFLSPSIPALPKANNGAAPKRKRGRPPKKISTLVSDKNEGLELNQSETNVVNGQLDSSLDDNHIWGKGELTVDTSFEEDPSHHDQISMNESDDFYLSLNAASPPMSPVKRRASAPVRPKPRKQRKTSNNSGKTHDPYRSHDHAAPVLTQEDHAYRLKVLMDKLKSQNEELEKLRAQQK